MALTVAAHRGLRGIAFPWGLLWRVTSVDRLNRKPVREDPEAHARPARAKKHGHALHSSGPVRGLNPDPLESFGGNQADLALGPVG